MKIEDVEIEEVKVTTGSYSNGGIVRFKLSNGATLKLPFEKEKGDISFKTIMSP